MSITQDILTKLTHAITCRALDFMSARDGIEPIAIMAAIDADKTCTTAIELKELILFGLQAAQDHVMVAAEVREQAAA